MEVQMQDLFGDYDEDYGYNNGYGLLYQSVSYVSYKVLDLLKQSAMWILGMDTEEQRRASYRKLVVLRLMAEEINKREEHKEYSQTFINSCQCVIMKTPKPRIKIQAKFIHMPSNQPAQQSFIVKAKDETTLPKNNLQSA